MFRFRIPHIPTTKYTRSLATALALCGGTVGAYAYARSQKEGENTITGEADLGGEFTLIDTEENTVSSEDLRGKYLLIYFGFTRCPDICPTEMHKLTAVTSALAKKKSAWSDLVRPVFITIDPVRDTPDAIKAYLSTFSSPVPILGLTGTPEDTAAAAKAYKVFSYPVPVDDEEGAEEGDYLIDHSIFIFLVGPDGKYLAHFGYDKSVSYVIDGVAKHLPKQWWEFWL